MLPSTKTQFSLLPQAPWPPWTNNSLILCTTADLIVSLWRESPELHSVKWQMVHPLRAGRTSLPPARAYRWAPPPPPSPLETMVGKRRFNTCYTLLHLSYDNSLILSPSLAPSQFMQPAAGYRCTSLFVPVSHLFLTRWLFYLSCAVQLCRMSKVSLHFL